MNRTDTISLSGLTDQDAPSVKEAIDSLEGVDDVTSEGSGELTITYDDDVVSLDAIKRAIEEQGETPASY